LFAREGVYPTDNKLPTWFLTIATESDETKVYSALTLEQATIQKYQEKVEFSPAFNVETECLEMVKYLLNSFYGDITVDTYQRALKGNLI